MLKTVQERVDAWVQQFKTPYWEPVEIMLRLIEEVGELAREVNHRFGPKKKKPTEAVDEVGDEIGDIIFTLTCLANRLGIDLDACFGKTLAKHSRRDNDRHERKTP